jgi:hypothetical protein
VFSQPVFHGVEMAFTDHVPGCARLPPLLLRLLLRSLYVAATTAVAIYMPFFTTLTGLVGALVFWPAAVYYPLRLYCKVYTVRRPVRLLMLAMNIAAAITSALAVAGAAWNIRQDVSKFTLRPGG